MLLDILQCIGQFPQPRIIQAKISLVLTFKQFDLYAFRKDKEEDKEEGGGEIRVRGVGKRRGRKGGREGGDGREEEKREGGERKKEKEQRDEGKVRHFTDILRKEVKLFSF